FFHEEDGIRYFHVTGVQTCALPIYTHERKSHSALTCLQVHTEIRNHFPHGRQIHFRLALYQAAGNNPTVRFKAHPLGRSQAHVYREPGTAQCGVAAHLTTRAIGVEVDHPKVISLPLPCPPLRRVVRRSEQNHPVRAHTRATGTEPANHLWGFQYHGSGGVSHHVEHHEVVPRARQLPEPRARQYRHAHSRPVIDCHLRRHTIHTASRMIFLDILDSPSVRSTNTIGSSFSLKPSFHARKLISIWKA